MALPLWFAMPSTQASRKAKAKTRARSKPKLDSKSSIATTTTPTSTANAQKYKVAIVATRKPLNDSEQRRRSRSDTKNPTSDMHPPPYQLLADPPLSYPITPPELILYPSFVPPELYYPPSPPSSPPPPQWSKKARAASSIDVSRVGRQSHPRIADRPRRLATTDGIHYGRAGSDARSMVSSKFESVIHCMDSESFTGYDSELSRSPAGCPVSQGTDFCSHT